MAIVTTITATAERKSDDYCKRVIGFSAEIQLEAGDDPRAVMSTWTRRLQFLCDQEIGDQDQPGSFHGARALRQSALTPTPGDTNG